MKFLVLLNHAAGAELIKGRIADRFAAAGADADVRLFEPRAFEEQIKDAAQSDIDAVIARTNLSGNHEWGRHVAVPLLKRVVTPGP